MKHILNVVSATLSAALLLSLAACGTADPEPTPTPEPAVEPSGAVADNIYTNSTIGIQFTAPESWVIATEEEMLDALEPDEDGDEIYDLYAVSEDLSQGLIISYTEMPVFPKFSSEMYAQQVFKGLEASGESDGLQAGDVYTFEKWGKAYAGLTVTSAENPLHLDVWFVSVDNYIYTFTFLDYAGTGTLPETLAENITALAE